LSGVCLGLFADNQQRNLWSTAPTDQTCPALVESCSLSREWPSWLGAAGKGPHHWPVRWLWCQGTRCQRSSHDQFAPWPQGPSNKVNRRRFFSFGLFSKRLKRRNHWCRHCLPCLKECYQPWCLCGSACFHGNTIGQASSLSKSLLWSPHPSRLMGNSTWVCQRMTQHWGWAWPTRGQFLQWRKHSSWRHSYACRCSLWRSPYGFHLCYCPGTALSRWSWWLRCVLGSLVLRPQLSRRVRRNPYRWGWLTCRRKP